MTKYIRTGYFQDVIKNPYALEVQAEPQANYDSYDLHCLKTQLELYTLPGKINFRRVYIEDKMHETIYFTNGGKLRILTNKEKEKYTELVEYIRLNHDGYCVIKLGGSFTYKYLYQYIRYIPKFEDVEVRLIDGKLYIKVPKDNFTDLIDEYTRFCESTMEEWWGDGYIICSKKFAKKWQLRLFNAEHSIWYAEWKFPGLSLQINFFLQDRMYDEYFVYYTDKPDVIRKMGFEVKNDYVAFKTDSLEDFRQKVALIF